MTDVIPTEPTSETNGFTDMDPDTLARIDDVLEHWDNPDIPERKNLERLREEWRKTFENALEAERNGDILTAADYRIRVNVI